jgi:CPA2 family monovalent cation:H+ antiporter-2
LVIEDIAGIFMMVMLSTIAVSQGISGGELAVSLLKMVFYLALWLIMGIFLLPTILKKTQGFMNDEIFLIVSLGICFGMVLLANYLGFSSALGAFLAGSLLAGTIHAERIEHINKPIKDLFGAVFFVSVGMMVNPAVIVQYIIPILIITFTVIFIKSIFSAAGVLLSGQSLHTAVLSGCSLAQIGEFSFIIASLGISLGVISDYIYPIIVSVSVITTFTTPFVIRSGESVYGFLNKILPKRLTNYLGRFTSDDRAESDSEWSAYIKEYFARLAIYSIIILGITLAGVWLLLPFLKLHLNVTVASVLTAVLVILLIVPFLRQGVFKKSNLFTTLWFKNRTNHLPLMALRVLRLGIMIVQIIHPIKMIFDFPVLYIFLAAVFFMIFVERSNWLLASYLKIEARFLINFNERQLNDRKDAAPDHSWLDEQIYVSRIICHKNSPFMNIPLNELMSKLKTPIKIIKIIRSGRHINIPDAAEKLLAEDIVFIAGTAGEKEMFQMFMSRVSIAAGELDYTTLREFIRQQDEYKEADQLFCFAVNVEKDSKLVGTRIKDSRIKDEWSSFMLGIERDYYPIISPDINMRIESSDLIWILGPQEMIGKLAKAQLL